MATECPNCLDRVEGIAIKMIRYVFYEYDKNGLQNEEILTTDVIDQNVDDEVIFYCRKCGGYIDSCEDEPEKIKETMDKYIA